MLPSAQAATSLDLDCPYLILVGIVTRFEADRSRVHDKEVVDTLGTWLVSAVQLAQDEGSAEAEGDAWRLAAEAMGRLWKSTVPEGLTRWSWKWELPPLQRRSAVERTAE